MAIIKENAKVLHLTLKKKWFDMIASGEKKEEYRDIKPYFATRFIKHIDRSSELYTQPNNILLDNNIVWKDYNWIAFKNGYSKDAPLIYVELLGFDVKQGRVEWGAKEYSYYFVLKLGEVIDTKIN